MVDMGDLGEYCFSFRPLLMVFEFHINFFFSGIHCLYRQHDGVEKECSVRARKSLL